MTISLNELLLICIRLAFINTSNSGISCLHYASHGYRYYYSLTYPILKAKQVLLYHLLMILRTPVIYAMQSKGEKQDDEERRMQLTIIWTNGKHIF